MTSRPLVKVQDPTKKEGHTMVPLPKVLVSPIRNDIVQFVHTNLRKNGRQPYAVSPKAGMQTAAESWGTGRAVSRIPRVPGGGTHRAGQGAFGNMCRGGRMFSPTKVYRRWHRKVNKGQRRYAVCSALAATALPALVMSRGHHIDHVPEIPLVIADSAIDNIKKTKEAVTLLKGIKAHEDVYKSKNSRKIRSGKGKARNRRRVQLKGPLVIHARPKSGNLARAFRNISGVDLANVRQLNLLQLAPGGHLGRFIIWTESAFKQLDKVFGTWKQDSEQKLGYRLPRAVMHNADLDRIINSDEIQSVIRPKRRLPFVTHRKNPLRNIGAMVKLNPWALEVRRRNLIRMQKAKDPKKKLKRKPRAKKAFVKLLLTPAIAPPRSAPTVSLD